ncbi:protoheme IX farnesyltransferase, partial [Acinetobacter baumannii]|nr:protoheme IX farnesyltransferase [Acinetobacter baumannii]
LSVVLFVYLTKIECVIYILFFASVLNGLYCFGYTNVFFLITFNALTAYWFYLSIIVFKAENDQLWAKRFFLYSVILLTLLSLSFSFTYQSPAPNLPLF